MVADRRRSNPIGPLGDRVWKQTPYEKSNNSSDATFIACEEELLLDIINGQNLTALTLSGATGFFLR